MWVLSSVLIAVGEVVVGPKLDENIIYDQLHNIHLEIIIFFKLRLSQKLYIERPKMSLSVSK